VQDVNERGHWQFVIFVEKKNLFNQKKQIFPGEKAFFQIRNGEISTFPDMAYSKFGPNYELR